MMDYLLVSVDEIAITCGNTCAEMKAQAIWRKLIPGWRIIYTATENPTPL